MMPAMYEEIIVNDHCFAVKFGDKWGFLNKRGKKITTFEYDAVEEFHDDMARVKKNGKYGFINAKFAVIVPLEYDDCEPYFSTSYDDKILPLWVKRDGKYGFVDISDNLKIKPKYDFAMPFESFVRREHSLAAVVMNGAVGFINEAGKTVIPFMYEPDFDDWNNYRFTPGYANVRLHEKWGVIDFKNRVVLPFIYDEFFDTHNGGFRCAMRDGKRLSIDAKGNEWTYEKNPAARTFRDYLHAVTWADVAESFVSLLGEESSAYEENFNNFRSKRHEPSNDIIRIFANDVNPYERPVFATMFNVENGCSYTFFDWAEILDMEVRIEDNLTLSDADVVAVCIWEAGDCHPMSEEGINAYLHSLRDDL
jgi:hypothetical protein